MQVMHLFQWRYIEIGEKTSALCVCVKFITLYSPVWRDSDESPAPIQYRSIRPHSIISISQSAALTVVTWPALLRPWSYYETNYIPFMKSNDFCCEWCTLWAPQWKTYTSVISFFPCNVDNIQHSEKSIHSHQKTGHREDR